MRKLIDIPEEIIPELNKIAAKEKRRGKRDPKNFIEDLIISYVRGQKK